MASKVLKEALKAKELRKLVDGIKATGGTEEEDSLPGSNHSNKRSKGDSGHPADTSPSAPAANLSPQCKADSTKRVSRQSPESSPHQEAGGGFLCDGSSESSQGSGSSHRMDTLDEDRRVCPISLCKIAQVTLPAQGRGGRRAAAPYAQGQGSQGSLSAQGYIYAPAYAARAAQPSGSMKDYSSLDGVISSSSDSKEDSKSGDSSLEFSRHGSGDPSGGILHGNRGVAKGSRHLYQVAISKHERKELEILEGAWPGRRGW